MKSKLATILAVLVLVAVGALNESQSKAIDATTFSPSPGLNSKGGVPPAEPSLQANWAFDRNYGRITRIYPEPTGTYFRFGGRTGQWQTAMNPTNGYYFIPRTHGNYTALVDLLYLAAEHDWTLHARTQPALSTGGRADVLYLVQDFSRP